MADIINSRNKKGKTLINIFKKLTEEANKTFKNNLLSPLTITLGDEFQGIPASLKDSILIIIWFEEAIAKNGLDIKLRYVLNYGSVDTEINPKIAHAMLGEGLTEARNILVGLKKNKSTRFHFRLKKPTDHSLATNCFILFQNIVDEWKQEDAPLLSNFLEGMNYKDVAGLRSKNISLMWKRNKSLKIEPYNAIKAIIHQLFCV